MTYLPVTAILQHWWCNIPICDVIRGASAVQSASKFTFQLYSCTCCFAPPPPKALCCVVCAVPDGLYSRPIQPLYCSCWRRSNTKLNWISPGPPGSILFGGCASWMWPECKKRHLYEPLPFTPWKQTSHVFLSECISKWWDFSCKILPVIGKYFRIRYVRFPCNIWRWKMSCEERRFSFWGCVFKFEVLWGFPPGTVRCNCIESFRPLLTHKVYCIRPCWASLCYNCAIKSKFFQHHTLHMSCCRAVRFVFTSCSRMFSRFTAWTTSAAEKYQKTGMKFELQQLQLEFSAGTSCANFAPEKRLFTHLCQSHPRNNWGWCKWCLLVQWDQWYFPERTQEHRLVGERPPTPLLGGSHLQCK